ncbi:MAG TPA: hypothetical protein VJT67_16870, partial [Longimicrobiaceae bacterium]|nr:hypothetical protein [Longimicrobiaceae bacterium]
MPTLPALEQSAVLGVVAGMRSMAAPAALSRHLARDPVVPANGVELLLTHPSAPLVLGIASAAEHVADKLPFVP